MLIKANNARVEWDSDKKRWEAHIAVGGEVVKRPLANEPLESSPQAITDKTVATAHDEGYELSPQDVQVQPNAKTSSGD
ncbi:MAG TPA: hypothetical protein VHW24_20530 [Bryobacteraceae bacterium]|jgi:hypothetical protein|nr:hypothetical protein [Bryobacteraceae bacterium]